jgi:hypothetical protein
LNEFIKIIERKVTLYKEFMRKHPTIDEENFGRVSPHLVRKAKLTVK